jgi:hypothetical protein
MEDVTVTPYVCTQVKVGDMVLRCLAGVVRMPQLVVKVDDMFIYTGDPDIGWRFERTTGFEFDPDLPTLPGTVCSYLIPPDQWTAEEKRLADRTTGA